jgi:trimethylamine--corrinoid protein Co-methyltransferase
MEGGGHRQPGRLSQFPQAHPIFQRIGFTSGYPVDRSISITIRHLEALRDAGPHRQPFHAVRSAKSALTTDRDCRIAAAYRMKGSNANLALTIATQFASELDTPMLRGIIGNGARNQALCITPFTLLGAMAPVTIAGAIAQQNAEALAAVTLSQIVRPGAPLIYGGFTSNVDMRSGAPAFGTPEYIKACLIGGQMARRYNMPYRSSNTNASVWPDAQATYEGAMSIWGALMGGTNMLLHGVGWLEGGLVASYEKYIIDAEMLQTMAEFFTPTIVDDSTLAIDAIREAGHGGHFFGVQHTIDRYETAFYTPLLSDWRNFQQWEASGSVDATHRATKIWKQLLADYQEPKLDPAIAEEMDAYIDRRTREGGAPYV